MSFLNFNSSVSHVYKKVTEKLKFVKYITHDSCAISVMLTFNKL